jgi:hypothetical protein
MGQRCNQLEAVPVCCIAHVLMGSSKLTTSLLCFMLHCTRQCTGQINHRASKALNEPPYNMEEQMKSLVSILRDHPRKGLQVQVAIVVPIFAKVVSWFWRKVTSPKVCLAHHLSCLQFRLGLIVPLPCQYCHETVG